MVHLSVTHKKFKTSKRLRDLNSLLTSKKAIKKQVLSKIFAFNVFQQRLLIFYVDAKVHRLFFYHFVWLFSLSLLLCIDFKFAGLHHTKDFNYISINHIHATYEQLFPLIHSHSSSLYINTILLEKMYQTIIFCC